MASPSKVTKAPPATVLAFERLSLTNFRNYKTVTLDLSPAPVVITGANGAGKTNLLEAISFFTPGRGLRRAQIMDVKRHAARAPWAVAATLTKKDKPFQIGTGQNPHIESRRIIRVAGETVPQIELQSLLAVLWVTPQMDRLFMDSASHRRQFVDRLAYNFDQSHVRHLKAYEQAMRERLKLLKDGISDANWLGALEHKMAEHGLHCSATRRHVLAQIEEACEEGIGPFPAAKIQMAGNFASLEGLEAAEFCEKLAENRALDGKAGMTTFGPHRDDLATFFAAKNMPAAQSSTGEQKALLISITLANARVLTRMNGVSPILLLDEIAAHLDTHRRACLFDEICAFSSQSWMTGTEDDLFKELKGRGQFFAVNNGQIT